MGKFPRLYAVSAQKGLVINDFGKWFRNGSSEDFAWQIPWRRKLFQWKKELERHLLEIVSNT